VKASSTVSGTAADVTWGQAGSVSVTVTPSAATGTVELYDGATKLGEGTLSSGATSVAIAARALEPGSHSLTVKYLGDSHYAASLGSVSVTVVKASSTVSGTAADVTWGQAGSVSVTVTPSAATGMVELYDGTTKLSQNAVTAGAGTITIPANALAVGEHELTLKYLGDTHYSASESTVDVTVVKAAATVTATPTPASVVQDSGTSTIAVAVTATGTTPTGTVSAWLGGTQLATATLSNGEADLVVGPFATTGTKSIEVRYSGSGDVSAATRTVTVTVTAKPTPQPTPTTVTGTDTTIQWAKAGSVAVSVAPSAATGTVELYEGATKLGTASLSGGAASFPLAAKSLAVGTHTMVVKYLGSSTHAASQGTVTVTVTKAKPKVQVEKPDKIKAGDKAKIKVAVTAPGYRATGEVRIVLRGVGKAITVVEDLKGGDAVARIKVTRPGKYEVTVTYLGDEHTLRGEDTTNLRVK
ncbi:hypothetical protein J2X46_000853, partial [Nocardioides sp. BE266]|uniref:Ig-like domain-containing protein n=1 Tax=Nocardioides sp. BE266 TaxID=2817725 RepID=UPI00285968BB